MENKDRLINEQAESVGQDKGQMHHPSSSQGSQFPFPSLNASDLRMAIQVEIEKEKIREEIIISEIARRRVLESEVRRELMRWIPAMGGLGQSLSFGPFPLTELVAPTRLAHLETSRGISFEETVRKRMGEANMERHDSVGFGMPTFHGSTSGLEIPEVKPLGVEACEGKKIIFLGKHEKDTSLSKRKLSSPPDMLPSGALDRKPKVDWSCSICRVHCNSQQVLDNHLQGKKHKAREKSDINHCTRLITEKNTTVDEAIMQDVNSTSGSVLLSGENPGPDTTAVLEKSVPAGKMRKNGKLEKKVNYRYWCGLCQVGTFSSKAMSMHEAGMNHRKRVKETIEVGPEQTL